MYFKGENLNFSYTLTESEIAYERNVGTIKYTMNTAVSQLDNGTPKQQMQNKWKKLSISQSEVYDSPTSCIQYAVTPPSP